MNGDRDMVEASRGPCLFGAQDAPQARRASPDRPCNVYEAWNIELGRSYY
jgi:hypothetical protein